MSAHLTAQSGQPYSAYVSNDINSTRTAQRHRAGHDAQPVPSAHADVVRSAHRARHPARRTRKLQLIWEAFNLFNRANYNVVQQTLYTVDLPTRALTRNAQFGQFTGQADPRIMQLAVKLAF